MTSAQRKLLAHIAANDRPVCWYSAMPLHGVPKGTRVDTLERLHVLGYLTRTVGSYTYRANVGPFSRLDDPLSTGVEIKFTLTESGRQALTE